jgi:hypothetical protein
MVRTRRFDRRTRWVALRAVFGLAALLGLFAMHGLASHGAMHSGHEVMPLPIVVTSGPEHGAHGAAMAVAAAEDRLHSALGDPGPAGPDLGLVGLCLAVLLMTAVAGILTRRFVRSLRASEKGTSGEGWPARALGDRDPPCLLSLSIQRC